MPEVENNVKWTQDIMLGIAFCEHEGDATNGFSQMFGENSLIFQSRAVVSGGEPRIPTYQNPISEQPCEAAEGTPKFSGEWHSVSVPVLQADQTGTLTLCLSPFIRFLPYLLLIEV